MSDIITTVIKINLRKEFNITDVEIKKVYSPLGFNKSIIIYIPKLKYLFKRRKIKKYLKENVILVGVELIIKIKRKINNEKKRI